MISHQYKSIFVHIPKTAGTSIEFTLGHFQTLEWGAQDHRSIREIEPLSIQDRLRMPFTGKERMILLKRARAKLIGRPAITRLQYQSYFKFTFVRNPWARIYSWYRNVMREVRHQRLYGVPPECSFPDFVHRYLDPLRGPMRPQLHWLLDKDNGIPLNFVGRFEHLTRDFGHVCDILQLRHDELPRLVTGEDTHSYTDCYDQAMIAVIARMYATEIDLFGYRFGD